MQNSIVLEQYGDLGVAYGRHGQNAGIISIAQSNIPADIHKTRIGFLKQAITPKDMDNLSRFDRTIVEPIVTKAHDLVTSDREGNYFVFWYGMMPDKIRDERIPVGVAVTRGFVRDNDDAIYFNDGSVRLAVMFRGTEIDAVYLPAISKRIRDKLGGVIRNIGTELHADAAKHVPVKPSEVLGLEARL